jgi:hypothetical protein
MNAYELADLIEEDMEEGFGMGFLQDAVNMLRQQADRIAELEKAFINQRVQAYAKSLTDGTKASAIAKVLNAEPKDIWTVCLDCGKRVTGDSIHTCSPQIKELSDEEIMNLYKETKADNGGIREFVRAILKKASEK